MRRSPLVWPPAVGSRICLDTGHKHNSWSGTVRAIVDDDYAVVKRWRPRKGWHTYEEHNRPHKRKKPRQAVRLSGASSCRR